MGLFGALPPALLMTVAGTALLGSMAGTLGRRARTGEGSGRRCGDVSRSLHRALLCSGSARAFWGLVFGLAVLAMERLFRR